jgi:hypothetical protein
MGARWTEQEFATLAQVYPVGGPAAVHAALPHRTTATIALMAHKLGIYFRGPSRDWTKDEDATLRLFYPVKGIKFVAIMLDRSPESVQGRAKIIGVRRDRSWKHEEDQIVVENYPRYGAAVVQARMLQHRTHQAVRQRAVHLDVKFVGLAGQNGVAA